MVVGNLAGAGLDLAGHHMIPAFMIRLFAPIAAFIMFQVRFFGTDHDPDPSIITSTAPAQLFEDNLLLLEVDVPQRVALVLEVRSEDLE